MKIVNKTAYLTRDLQKFFGACIRHMGSSPNTQITVVYRRGGSDYVSGWATFNTFTMRLRLPKPGKLRLIDLAFVLEHEVSHNLGVEHKDMDRECFRSSAFRHRKRSCCFGRERRLAKESSGTHGPSASCPDISSRNGYRHWVRP